MAARALAAREAEATSNPSGDSSDVEAGTITEAVDVTTVEVDEVNPEDPAELPETESDQSLFASDD